VRRRGVKAARAEDESHEAMVEKYKASLFA
jgi:hypothetical protein